ncbi:hypothetical protein ACHAPO_006172 [Fusarium lateritium]
MFAVCKYGVLIIGFVAGLSQAEQGDRHMLLRRVPQVHDLPRPIIPISSTVHTGNSSVVSPPADSVSLTSTSQSIQPSTPFPETPTLRFSVSHDAGISSEIFTETSLDKAYSKPADSTLIQTFDDKPATISTSQFDVVETLPVTSYSTTEFPTPKPVRSQDISTNHSLEDETPVFSSTGDSSERYTQSDASSKLTTDASNSLSTTSAVIATTTEAPLDLSEPADITGDRSSAIFPETSEATEYSQTSWDSSTEYDNPGSAAETSLKTEVSSISETWKSTSSDTMIWRSETNSDSSQTCTGYDGTESEAPSGMTGSGDITSMTMSSEMRQPSRSLETPSESTDSVIDSDRLVQPTQVPTTKQDATPTPTGAGDMLVTGTDGTIATYVPEQDSSYVSSTETITSTDENGDAIIIFPFGWFWRLDGSKGGAGVIKPPAPTINPGMVNQPDDKEGDDQDDEDKDEDNSSTENGDESTVASTTYSTTEWPTTITTGEPETITTTEECTAMTQPDCTRTISYITSDGTHIMTEFGECPTIVSCATETQTTATVTLSELIWAGGATETPVAIIPVNALIAEVDQELIDALEEEWAEIFDRDDWLFPGVENGTKTFTEGHATETLFSDKETSTNLALTTDLTATRTTESGSPLATTTPSTLVTRTKASSDTLGVTGTTEEAIQTFFPCVIHGGPAVETPYCQCSTTIDGQGYYATTTLVDNKCLAYTEFPAEITSAPPSGPVTEAPIQEPITTTTDGTVLVWSAYILEYINIAGITRITHSVGVGQPSTVSTPLPSQTAVDNDGGGQCGTADSLSKQGLREACDRAIDQFSDDVVYTSYVSRYSRLKKGILMTASFGKAACVAKFQCDDYGIGMTGFDIKAAYVQPVLRLFY